MTEQEKLEMSRGAMDSRPFSQKNEQEQQEIIRRAGKVFSYAESRADLAGSGIVLGNFSFQVIQADLCKGNSPLQTEWQAKLL